MQYIGAADFFKSLKSQNSVGFVNKTMVVLCLM